MAENRKKQRDPANDRNAGDLPPGAEQGDEQNAYRQSDADEGYAQGGEPEGGESARRSWSDEGEEGFGESLDHVEEEITDEMARIQELQDELATMKDHAMRAMAEAENVRKRAERQVSDANRYGAAGLARDVLDISDNLRRALEALPADAAEGNEALANLRAGVEMTEKELQNALARHGVKEVSPQPGEKFDHNYHQAMFEMETEDYPPGTVAQVMQAGYVLHDRLLRAAMVGVAKAPQGAGNAGNSGDNGSGDDEEREVGG